ncbi:hypothetical protein F4677DRAFT_286024 [Hypoxylon crocopeplum]|nr:hypothetical protein F4677DRAFT_286024 [Hypoxylon crocopeplum]
MSSTPMEAGTIMEKAPVPHLEFFWLNSSSMLSGQNFRDGYSPFDGVFDSIDLYPVAVNEKSRLATYWPYAVMQDEDNSLRLVTYLNASQVGPWTNESLGISGLEGTGVTIIPRSSTYAFPHTAGLIYRTRRGQLTGNSLECTFPGLDWDMSILTDTPNTIPQETAIAAFAVAKEDDPNNSTSIHLVYQNVPR